MSEEVPSDVILPPVDTRETIDKTAGYVHRNGASFEHRLRDKESSNNKFNFIQSNDPYNKYYRWKLDQFRAGKVAVADTSKDTTPADSTAPTKLIDTPDEFDFHIELPPLSALDLDIIKLTALFVAKNGDTYMDHVKAHRNQTGQFDFLNKSHSLHTVFRKFVQQYQTIIDIPSNTKIINKIDNGINDPNSVLASAYLRAEHMAKEELNKQKESERIEKEKLEYASIDWQDFVIVETIEFTDADNVTELPLPITLSELQYRSLEHKKANTLLEEVPPDFDEKEELISRNQRQPQAATHTSSLPTRPTTDSYINTNVPKGMKIKAAGETRRKGRNTNSERYIQCPLTGQQIPESKFTEHIRILLRDPRYIKEKESFEKKNLTYNNLTTDEVYENIKKLIPAKNRNQTPEYNTRNKVQWDGYSGSVDTVKRAAAESYSAEEVERMKKRRQEQENKIGPH